MLDLKFFRENLDLVREGIAKKKFACDLDAILALDAERREVIHEAESLRAAQKAANADMAAMPKGSDAFRAKVGEMKDLASRVKILQARQTEIETRWKTAFLGVPNLPHASVPVGRTEEDNVVFATSGDPAAFGEAQLPHWDLPWFADLVDLGRGAKVTGAGWPFLVGDMARLARALLQFFLDENAAAGFTEMMPPICVNADSATATGQLPDKEGQMYVVPEDGLYLIPTAEVPVTNYYRDETFSLTDLPKRACAYTPCFRREAGSHGKDVRGLNRLHQFDKVEIVKWVHPEESFEALEALRTHVEGLLGKLGLPFRTLLMCSGDIGFPHAKQYDLEVWAAGQKRWLEVSSCSNFTDFQARRANIRFRDAEGRVQFVHTLNGSALALPRIIAALLENGHTGDGTVHLPPCLHSYFRGESLPR
jgi:seryl-tRNA synthetase